MKKIISIVCCCLLLQNLHAQQNTNYVHYMFNGILFNPAYAGSHEALNLTALYRKQWWGIGGSPVTLSFGAHSPLKNNKVCVGMVIENERLAIYNNTRANAIYAYRVKLPKGKLAFGIQAGVENSRADWTRIHTHDENDPNFAPSLVNTVKPIAGAGLYYNTTRFYMGVSSPALYYDGSVNYNSLILNTGGLLKLSEVTWLKPAVLLKSTAGSPLSLNGLLAFYYKDLIGLGAGLTYKTSFMTFIDVKLNDQLNFGYGFEGATNKIRTYSSGSHEIMLRYLFRYRINAVNARYF
jgi:type IX secretion system PorP/SprF family membrane protein